MAHLRSLVVLTLTSFAGFGCSQPTDDTPNETRHVEAAGNPFAPTRHYEPDENGAHVSGRVDAALVPAGTRFRALLESAVKSPSRSASVWSTDGTFTFEDVPPGDWRVNVHTATISDSWTWNTNVTGLVRDEERDLGTLELLPTQITVRARIERADGSGPRPDGVTEADSHIEVDVDAPFMKPRWLKLGSVSVAAEEFEHVFHGLPREQISLGHEARAPLSPSQRLIAGRHDEAVRLSDAPVAFEFVSTIESGPVPRPHARLRLTLGVRRADVASSSEAWRLAGGSGHMGPSLKLDTLDELGFAYIELEPGRNAFTAVVMPRDERTPWFFSGEVEVEAGLNVGFDFEPVPTVRVQLVLPANETLERYTPPDFAPSAAGEWLSPGGAHTLPDVDPASGERSLVECVLPVGWLARISSRSDHEWQIPAEGGRVLPRPRE